MAEEIIITHKFDEEQFDRLLKVIVSARFIPMPPSQQVPRPSHPSIGEPAGRTPFMDTRGMDFANEPTRYGSSVGVRVGVNGVGHEDY